MPPKDYAARFEKLNVDPMDFPNLEMQNYLKSFQKQGGDLNASMRSYMGDISQLDDHVARLLKAIDEAGLRDNTLVVFSSDNVLQPINRPLHCLSLNFPLNNSNKVRTFSLSCSMSE